MANSYKNKYCQHDTNSCLLICVYQSDSNRRYRRCVPLLSTQDTTIKNKLSYPGVWAKSRNPGEMNHKNSQSSIMIAISICLAFWVHSPTVPLFGLKTGPGRCFARSTFCVSVWGSTAELRHRYWMGSYWWGEIIFFSQLKICKKVKSRKQICYKNIYWHFLYHQKTF